MSVNKCVVTAAVVAGLLVGPGTGRASAAVSSLNRTHYVVRPGDTLTGIAQRMSVPLALLQQANGLRSTATIRPGQILLVPSTSASAPVAVRGVLPRDLQTTEKRALIPLFRQAARESGIASDLLMSLAYTESSWSQAARSADRAVGLGQLLPATSRWVATSLMGEPALDARNASDNLRITAFYLRYLIKKFPGNGQHALAAYFEGESLVRRVGPSASGRRYALKILNGRTMFSEVL